MAPDILNPFSLDSPFSQQHTHVCHFQWLHIVAKKPMMLPELTAHLNPMVDYSQAREVGWQEKQDRTIMCFEVNRGDTIIFLVLAWLALNRLLDIFKCIFCHFVALMNPDIW